MTETPSDAPTFSLKPRDPGTEPSKKRSRTDLNAPSPPEKGKQGPVGHPVREDALPIWRQARNHLSLHVKMQARAHHLTRLASAKIPPAWAYGADRLPQYLCPPSQQSMSLRREHACTVLHQAADELLTRSTQELRRGEALSTSFRQILEDDKTCHDVACALLNDMVSKDRATTRTQLSEREQTTPPSNEAIAYALQYHTTVKTPFVPKQPGNTKKPDFPQGSAQPARQSRSGTGPKAVRRHQNTTTRKPKPRARSPRPTSSNSRRSPRRTNITHNSMNLTPKEEALIRAFRS